jgi:hypothetical protein
VLASPTKLDKGHQRGDVHVTFGKLTSRSVKAAYQRWNSTVPRRRWLTAADAVAKDIGAAKAPTSGSAPCKIIAIGNLAHQTATGRTARRKPKPGEGTFVSQQLFEEMSGSAGHERW